MQKIKHLTSLKNALLNVADLIENEYESIAYTKDLIWDDQKVDYKLLIQELSKFCTLVKDFSLMNKLDNNCEYFDLQKNPEVYLDYK